MLRPAVLRGTALSLLLPVWAFLGARAAGVGLVGLCLYWAVSHAIQERRRRWLAAAVSGTRNGLCEFVFDGVGGRSSGPFGSESLACLADFSVTDIVDAPHFPELLKAHPERFTPYSAEFEGQYLTFVDVEPAQLQDTSAAFYYQQQRRHATRVYGVAFSTLVTLMEELEPDEVVRRGDLGRAIFLQSTGRCGSTLLCKLLGATNCVQTISEPDCFTGFAAEMCLNPGSFDARAVLRATTWFLLRAATAQDPSKPRVVMKFRGHVLRIGPALSDLLPEAKSLFLYRNAVDVVDSYCMAFFNHGLAGLVRRLNLDALIIYHCSVMPDVFPLLSNLIADRERFPWHMHKTLGAVGVITMGWLSSLETATAMAAAGQFDAVLQYEVLVAEQAAILPALVTRLLPGAAGAEVHEARAQAIFGKDAHGDNAATTSARRRTGSKGPLFTRPDDLVGMQRLIARHETIQTSGYVVPGSLRAATAP